MQYQAKLEMAIRIHNGVQAKDLFEFIYSGEDDPKWIKKNKEFEQEGHLYDIVEKIERGDSTIYFCLKDTRETKLDQRLKRLVSINTQHDFQNKDNQKRPTNYYKFQYVSGSIPWENFLVTRKNNIFLYQQNYNSPVFAPPVPPPEPFSLA
jgi:hypothetical protein